MLSQSISLLIRITGCMVFLIAILPSRSSEGQVGVYLPQYSQFSVQSSFFIPDGGSLYQGGTGRMGMGYNAAGMPFLGNVPGVGRLGRNRGIGYSSNATSVVTSVQSYSLREIGDGLLAGTHDRYGNVIVPYRNQDQEPAPSLNNTSPASTLSVYPSSSNRPANNRSPEEIRQRARFLKANLGRNR